MTVESLSPHEHRRRRAERSAPDMIDVDVVDGWFEASKNLPGGPARFAVFDRNALFTLDQLVEATARETGETCTIEFLQQKAAEGWFPLLPRPGTPDELGAPMY